MAFAAGATAAVVVGCVTAYTVGVVVGGGGGGVAVVVAVVVVGVEDGPRVVGDDVVGDGADGWCVWRC